MKKTKGLSIFLRYVTLNVCGMLGLSCYILADTFFISKGLGSDGLTALNLAIPVYSFVHGVALMFGMGGATKYSIFMGQNHKKEANEIFNNTLKISVVTAGIFLLVGILFSKQLAIFLGATDNILGMTNIYLKVILLFAPAFIINEVLLSFVRNDENPGLAMIAMLTGSFANIILDYIFIFPMQWGIFGAVIATSMAPLISMGVLWLHRAQGKQQFFLKKVKVSSTMIGNIVKIGIPSLITEVASGIVMIIFNVLILGIEGNIGVAAYGIIANLSLVFTSVYTGIAQGIQPLISEGYGRNDGKQIKIIYRYALITLSIISIIIYALCFKFADSITIIFNSEKSEMLQNIAVEGMKLYFIAVPFIGFNIVTSVFFSAIERVVPAQSISLLRGIILIVPMAYLLASIYGMAGIWLTVPVTEGIVTALGVVLIIKWWKQLMIY